MNLTKFFYYVVSLSLMGSTLLIGLLIIKGLFRQKLSANWHYYIWFLFLLRLIIPFTPSAPFSVFNFIPHYHQAIDLSKISIPNANEVPLTTSIQPHDNNAKMTQVNIPDSKDVQKYTVSPAKAWFSWQTLASVWMIGVIVNLFYILFINGLFFMKIKKLPFCDSAGVLRILKECKANLRVHSEVSVVYDTAIKSPAVFGLFHPKIIISPEIIKKVSPEELRYILLHELSHLKRGDLVVHGLTLAIQAVYWFNPLIWYALYQMKQDCEIACDAKVLVTLNAEEHQKYGLTIIRLLQLLSEPYWAPGTLCFISKFNTRRIIMISTFKKTTMKWSVAALASILLIGCSSLNNPIKATTTEQNQKDTAVNVQQNANINKPTPNKISTSSSSSTDSNAIVYKNIQYGFTFSLPESWNGYSIVIGQWKGLAVGGDSGESIAETGPMISIRDPQWSSKTPRQDIPIMVFTLRQWNSLQQGVFHIGAAPIGPSELGRNNVYVFALPARYNFAFPPGYEEVGKILESSPLQATEILQSNQESTESLLSTMIQLGKQGKVINSDFSAKTNTIEDIEKVLGKADKTDWVAAAKGRYATYTSHNVVFGMNKGDQIFEIRSFDSRLKDITISKAKEILGTPGYDNKSNGQEIIGYTVSPEFKVEMVFTQPTSDHPNPVMGHYNVLYPLGTKNLMSGDPGRQW